MYATYSRRIGLALLWALLQAGKCYERKGDAQEAPHPHGSGEPDYLNGRP